MPRTSILISASGAMSFTTTNPSATNVLRPHHQLHRSPMIAGVLGAPPPVDRRGLHPDLRSAPNRRFVVQWDSVVYSSGTGFIDVRAVLKEGKGDIETCYVNTISGSTSYDSGYGATAGIQSGTGTGLQFSCNTASLLNGLVLTYTAP